MSTDTVSVACRLPNGYVLEVGFSVNVPAAGGGASFAMYRKNKDYQTYTLKGCNQHSLIRDPRGNVLMQLPSAAGREPFINHGIPKDFFDRWCKENAENWALTSGQIFVVPKPADTKAVTADAAAKSPAIFEPLDPSVPMKLAENEISQRTDDL